MPWFKVDDKLHSHPKVVKAGIPAMGLWSVAGSWCSDQLTDGFVPDYMARRFDPDFTEHAAALVAAGLWEPGQKNGENGWYYHDWADEGRQPTAESVRAKRAEARDRMARLRTDRAARTADPRDTPDDTPDGSQSVRANTPRTSDDVRSAPTRPDPTYKKQQQQPRARPADEPAPTAAPTRDRTPPAQAVPLVDALTAAGHVVGWNLTTDQWRTVTDAIERSGLPALVNAAARSHKPNNPARYATAWLDAWSSLPPLTQDSPLHPQQQPAPLTPLQQRRARNLDVVRQAAAEEGLDLTGGFTIIPGEIAHAALPGGTP